MSETREVLGFNVTSGGDIEATERYLERFRAELASLGISGVVTHASDLPQLLPFTWHNYVDMPNGEPVITQVINDGNKVIDIQLRSVELSGAQIDPSIARGDHNYIRFDLYIRGTVISFNYYPGQRMVVGPDIFHTFNDGGIAVVSAVIDAIKALKIQTIGGIETNLPPDKAVVVMGGKIYNLDIVGVGDLDAHYKDRVVRVKLAAQQFERRILSNYQSAVTELRQQRERLMRDMLSMPILGYEMVARGVGLNRFLRPGDRGDGTFYLTKDVNFIVAKVFKIGGGMPVRIPEEFKLKINGVMHITCKPGEGGKYTPLSVSLYDKNEAAAAAGVLIGVTHPHVMDGGAVCIGDYHLPPYIELRDLSDQFCALNVFAELCKTLSTLNPQSWYQSSANKTPQLRDWIYEHIPESNPHRG